MASYVNVLLDWMIGKDRSIFDVTFQSFRSTNFALDHIVGIVFSLQTSSCIVLEGIEFAPVVASMINQNNIIQQLQKHLSHTSHGHHQIGQVRTMH